MVLSTLKKPRLVVRKRSNTVYVYDKNGNLIETYKGRSEWQHNDGCHENSIAAHCKTLIPLQDKWVISYVPLDKKSWKAYKKNQNTVWLFMCTTLQAYNGVCF